MQRGRGRMVHPVLAKLDTIDCVFISRLNRFVGTALIDGRVERVHITNTGRLREYLVEGRQCKVVRISGKKLKYRLVAVKDGEAYAVIDTRSQSLAFERAVEAGLLCFARGCRIAGREPSIGEGRLDYVLDCPVGRVLVELKSAVLRGPGGEAQYPDCPTARGVKHVEAITRLYRDGVRVAIVFTAALPGARCFMPYREGDPRLYGALTRALSLGVPIYSYNIYMDDEGRIRLGSGCLPLCKEWVESK